MKLWDARNPEMHHLATTSLLLKLTSIFFISSASADPTNVTAEPGQNIILPCRTPHSEPVVAVEWSRTDLGSEYVLLYRNNQFDLEHQHPSFKNRVDLQEGQIMVGDVSLVLKNVSTDDRGTYECLIIQTETTNRRQTVLYINLDVVPPPGEPDDGSKGGSHGLELVVGLAAGLLSLAAIFFAILYFKRKKKSNPNQPPGAAAGHMLNLTLLDSSAEQ
ncbi:uncharacterized protein LOC118558796 [Fundulus heteroclitus]|uniref:uncharacterized protein LOC118558796 n=1 Tax=Fundulus heteroclitus TaxID=8078 RepID=UPI00165C88E6|nr:uncharacterized protein LOC118558796 [Fundulus heteroclitus]